MIIEEWASFAGKASASESGVVLGASEKDYG